MLTTIDKIAWVYTEDGRILCARSKGKDTYYIPGGKREPGESDAEALLREVREELSVALKPDTISLYGIFEAEAHGKTEGVQVKMTCYCAEFEGSLSPAAEIEEICWLNYRDRDRVSAVSQLIFDQLHKQDRLI
ncbi:DNA mismatch repair protein MutT [Paenibacillus sp. CAA11]|uniref:NUDIX hydrolase n=1 Tax=Paenibacillus sp. CAA11 TaxID=1532905 RepID=UPI000D3764C7|nr:NUDIX domain-containing protein [Paenibacillus sp. CAA11]AWB44586.1 DNA mismatch repair protein MutT [Paenibacillus sp. CAA11]